MIFERFAPKWAWGRHSRRAFLDKSEIGIPDPPPEIFESARFWYISWSGISWFSRRIYRDRFFRSVDLDYGRFAKLPFPTDEKNAMKNRVLACIRTIAAFSAWEEVSWSMVEVGINLAILAAAIAGISAGLFLLSPAPRGFQIVLALGIIIASIVGARAVALEVPRTWPTCALLLVAWAAGAAMLLRAVMVYTDAAWRPPLMWTTFFEVRSWLGTAWVPYAEVSLWTAFAVWTGSALALSISAMFFIRATARRIGRFPEEEIVQVLAAMLGELCDSKSDWRSGVQRGRIVDRLEWVARRLADQFVNRYTGQDHATDAILQQTAMRCATRLRAQKRMVVFPSEHTLADLQAFLWDALRNAAGHTWNMIEGDELVEVEPSRRQRLFSGLRTAAAVVAPAAVSFAFFNTTADQGIRTNVLITGLAWSALTVLAILNPKQFENQLAAAKSIGTVIKNS